MPLLVSFAVFLQKKLLDDNKLQVFNDENNVKYPLSDGIHILQFNQTTVFLQIPLLIAVILSLNQWMAATEWCNPMKELMGILKNELSFTPTTEE